MISLILRTATGFLHPLLLLFSVFVLLRGHNSPGGGFVGGLVAAAAFVLYAIAYDPKSTRDALWIEPHSVIGFGLLLAVSSGLLSLVLKAPFMTGQWTSPNIPAIGEIHLGTPMIFDIGVYLVVVGVTLMIILALAEE